MNKEEITEEQVKDNLETGLVMAIEEKSKVLAENLKELSKKELIRLIKSAASFPNPNLRAGATQAELTAVQNLYAIKDLQVELAICTIGRAQEEQNNSEGEDNE
jgi:chemotaxis response regulator CheB